MVRERKELQITGWKLGKRTGALLGTMTSLVAKMLKYPSVNVQPQAKKTAPAIFGTNGSNSRN